MYDMDTNTEPRKRVRLTSTSMEKVRKAFSEHLKSKGLADKAKKSAEAFRDRLRDEVLVKYGYEDVNGHLYIIFDEDDVVTDYYGKPVYGMKREKRSGKRVLNQEKLEALFERVPEVKDVVVERTIEVNVDDDWVDHFDGLREYLTSREELAEEVNEDALLAAGLDPSIPNVGAYDIRELYDEADPNYAFVSITKPVKLEELQLVEE